MSDYLGTALKHPLAVVNGAGVIVPGPEAIKQSIRMILMTPVGSRFFLREYGSKLQELLFEQNDTVFVNMVYQYVYDALTYWEKRVQFLDCQVTLQENDAASISITYKILSSNEVDSFVYPFYRQLIY